MWGQKFSQIDNFARVARTRQQRRPASPAANWRRLYAYAPLIWKPVDYFTFIAMSFIVIYGIGIGPVLGRKMSKCIFNLGCSPGQLGRSEQVKDH